MSQIGQVSQWNAFLTAVQFLTRVPVSGAMTQQIQDYKLALRASVAYFPLVGLLIGIATTSVYSLALCFWPPWIAAFLAIGFEAWLTGAFHEDAFADAADALGGGWTRERILEILKDSRHGTYGVMALVVGVGLRAALISNCSFVICWLMIPYASALGRWSILLLMGILPPIEDRHTMVRDVGSRTSTLAISLGLIAPVAWSCLVVFFWLKVQDYDPEIPMRCLFASLATVLVACVVTWIYGRMIRIRVGGVTGDFLGANCFLIQLVTLLVLQAVIH